MNKVMYSIFYPSSWALSDILEYEAKNGLRPAFQHRGKPWYKNSPKNTPYEQIVWEYRYWI